MLLGEEEEYSRNVESTPPGSAGPSIEPSSRDLDSMRSVSVDAELEISDSDSDDMGLSSLADSSRGEPQTIASCVWCEPVMWILSTFSC